MTDLISQGLQLALFGMGTVFVFLTALIFFTKLMSWAVLSIEGPVIEEDSIEVARAGSRSALDDDHAKLLVVISAAIKQYKSRH